MADIRDDPDLEDGEIASDDDGEKGEILPKKEKQSSREEKPQDSSQQNVQQQRHQHHRSGDGKRGRDSREERSSRRPHHNEPEKKKKRDEEVEPVKVEKVVEAGENEDELLGLCVRGASPEIDMNAPIWSRPKDLSDVSWQETEEQEIDDEGDEGQEKTRRRSDGYKRGAFRREDRELRNRIQAKRKLKRKIVEKELCINFMKGSCNKGADCMFSHTAEPPRKMELCKFYLKDRCMKRDMCLYLHEEFPCKFYHTGLKCFSGRKCKFSHEPLNAMTKEILLKHMETAPKEILGDFPRLSRENAEAVVGGREGEEDDKDGGRKEDEHRRRDEGQEREGSGRFRGQNENRRNEIEDSLRHRRRSPDGGRDRRGRDFRHNRGGRNSRFDAPRDKQQFGPDFGGDGPDDRRHGPRDQSFGPDEQDENRFGPNNDQRRGSNFGVNDPGDFGNEGPGDRRFGPRRPNVGANDFPDFGNDGGRDRRLGSRGSDFGANDSGDFGNDGPGNRGPGPRDLGPNDSGDFGNDGPGDRRFGPRGPKFGAGDGNFGNDGPGDRRFGPRGHNDGIFDDSNDRKRGNDQGFNRFDGPNDRRGPNDGDGRRFGPDDRWGRGGSNFNNNGPGDRRFGPRNRNYDNNRRNDGRNRNFGGPDDRFNDRNFNQGADGPGNMRNGPDSRFHGRDGPDDGGNFGPGNFVGSPPNFPGQNNFSPGNFGPMESNDFGPGGRRFGNEEPDKGRNSEGDPSKRHHGSQRRSKSQDIRDVGDNAHQGEVAEEPMVPKKKKDIKKPFLQSADDTGSGTSSPFDFAKELAEYKNKQMESQKQLDGPSHPHPGDMDRFSEDMPLQQGDMFQVQQTQMTPFEQQEMMLKFQQSEMRSERQKHSAQQRHQHNARQGYQHNERQGYQHNDRQEYQHDQRPGHQQNEGQDYQKNKEQQSQPLDGQNQEPDPYDLFPPPFTQVYPPFPSEEEKSKSKSKSSEGSNKKHKKKSKRKLEIVEEDDEEAQHRRSKKEKRHKEHREKRQPVIVSEDGSFGGIKFKIKLNRDKDPEVQPVLPPSEFLSSDDERPLSKLVRNKKNEDKDKDSEETDTECRLVIETNDEPEPEEKRSPSREEPRVPTHLPERQKELFRRIQSHVTSSPPPPEEVSKNELIRTPTPEPVDENWYSSDDEPVQNVPESIPVPAMLPPPAAAMNIPMPTASPSLDKSPTHEELPPRSTTPPGPPPQPPKFELAALKDLSKINITELLSSIRQVTAGKPPVPGGSMFGGVPPSTSYDNVEFKDPRMRGGDVRGSPAQNVQDSPKPRRPSEENKPSYAKSIYDMPEAGTLPAKTDSDLRFRTDTDERVKDQFGDIDLRSLTDPLGLPPLGLGLPFKPAPIHTAATEIEAGLGSHPPIDYKVSPIYVPPIDFSSIKIPPTDPHVKKDPRLRRLYRISSVEEPKVEEPKKPVDPRRKGQVPETPKSPPSMQDTPFSPPHEPPRVSRELLSSILQLGLSAAAGGADPRLRGLGQQEIDALRSAAALLRPEDIEALTAPREGMPLAEPPRMVGQGLLPTPGMGLLPTPQNFMMNPLMPIDPMMAGPMGNPLGGPGMPGPHGPGPMNMGPFGFNEGMMGDIDNRGFRIFKGDRRGGRGGWRGGRDRNWDNRRPRDRGTRHRDKDDRKSDRNRSQSPTE